MPKFVNFTLSFGDPESITNRVEFDAVAGEITIDGTNTGHARIEVSSLDALINRLDEARGVLHSQGIRTNDET